MGLLPAVPPARVSRVLRTSSATMLPDAGQYSSFAAVPGVVSADAILA